MKRELLLDLQASYLEAFVSAHVKTFTNDYSAHKASEVAYLKLENALHHLMEKFDQYNPSSEDEWDIAIKNTYDSCDKLWDSINESIKDEDNEDIKDSLVKTLSDVKDACTALKSVMQEEIEEWEAWK